MASIVGTKGQIVIEKSIREALGLRSGYIAVQKLVENHVEVHFYPPEHREPLRGILSGTAQRTVPPKRWSEAQAEAWSEAVAGEWQANEASQ